MKKITIIFIITFVVFLSYKIINQKRSFTIGGGVENSFYYPVAQSLCLVYNNHKKDGDLVCEAKLSQGAEYNINAVDNGEFDMAITQTSLQYDAYSGHKKYSQDLHRNIRTIFTLHKEYFTIIVKKDSKINSFADLRGKKVNISNIGSGSRVLFNEMVERVGWSLDDFKEIYSESGSNIKEIICDANGADAAIYIVGHPSKNFSMSLNDCKTKLISLSEVELEYFTSLDIKKFYKTFIPKNSYPQVTKNIKTFAEDAVLSASANLDPKIVRNFVRIIKENKSELFELQPSLKDMKFFEEKQSGLAPIHQGVYEF